MKNPYETDAQYEHEYGVIDGYTVLVTEWSDRKFTAFISRKEYGIEDVIMDNDIEWDERPDESKLQEFIEEALEDRFDKAHP